MPLLQVILLENSPALDTRCNTPHLTLSGHTDSDRGFDSTGALQELSALGRCTTYTDVGMYHDR